MKLNNNIFPLYHLTCKQALSYITGMKTPLECVENYEDPAYEAEMSFGEQVIKVNVPAVKHYRGQRFTAHNKAEVKSALATGKWKLNN